jgi:hypothetical protein
VVFTLHGLAPGRVFFSGSNPMMTVFAFPQDILLVKNDYAYSMHSYMRQPWWGDIDQPDLRPSTTYLLTGEKIGSKKINNYFEHDGNLYNWKNSLGFTKTISETFKTRFDIDYTWIPFRNYARGIISDSLGSLLSYDYAEKHAHHDYYLTSYFATYFREMPVGFKIGFGQVSATVPELDFRVKTADSSYALTRHFWAWSTLRGSKVFDGYEGEEHARTQDNYTAGTVNRFDLQAAVTLPKLKTGGRFRRAFGELSLYNWNSDTGADQNGSEVFKKGIIQMIMCLKSMS